MSRRSRRYRWLSGISSGRREPSVLQILCETTERRSHSASRRESRAPRHVRQTRCDVSRLAGDSVESKSFRKSHRRGIALSATTSRFCGTEKRSRRRGFDFECEESFDYRRQRFVNRNEPEDIKTRPNFIKL